MTTSKIITDRVVNKILRRAELKYIMIFTLIVSFVYMFIVNYLALLVEHTFFGSPVFSPVAFFNLIINNVIFNYATSNIIFLMFAFIYAYYLHVEAKIHFKNRKYYITENDSLTNVFNLPISLIFAILTTTFYSFSFVFLIMEFNTEINPIDILVIIFLVLFVVPFLVAFYFFQYGLKYFLFNMLLMMKNITIILKKDLNDRIYDARVNNTELCLIIIKVMNIEATAKKIDKSNNFILKYVIKTLENRIRETDFVVPLNRKKALIGCIVMENEKYVNTLITDRIEPILLSDVSYKDKKMGINITYEIINLQKSEEIHNIKDILSYCKISN